MSGVQNGHTDKAGAAALPGETRWTDLGVRTATAVFLIPAVLLDIWQGGIWFKVFAAFLGLLIAHEWTNIAHARSSTQFALHAAAALIAAFLPQDMRIADRVRDPRSGVPEA
jgi:phosphatidate cytidylyltransferase